MDNKLANTMISISFVLSWWTIVDGLKQENKRTYPGETVQGAVLELILPANIGYKPPGALRGAFMHHVVSR